MMIAESPNTAAEVWIQRAQQVPKADLRPPNFPTEISIFCNNSSIGTIDPDVKRWINLTPSEISKLQKSQIFEEYSLALDYENVDFKYDIAFILNCLDVKNCGIKIGPNHEFLNRRLVRERTNKFNY
ncbi:hypothetical protein J2Y67_004200 [Neobacillus niacini]|nr:hypothetical protein [Neobacillus niacini]